MKMIVGGNETMEYSNAQLLDMLLELDAEEIVKVDEEFKAEHRTVLPFHSFATWH